MNHETAAGILNMGRQIDQIAQMHNSNREQVFGKRAGRCPGTSKPPPKSIF
jgi:hypothetical protein